MKQWVSVTAFFLVTITSFAADVTITDFMPTGEAKKIRQAKAVFSEAMVPLGQPSDVIPFAISCPVTGSGRWISQDTWVYTFAEELPGGIRCTFTPNAPLRSLSGATLSTATPFSFSTGGPAIVDITPYEGNYDIAEDQIFILFLDSDASSQSILASSYFSVEGIAERVETQLVTGSDRTDILRARHYDKDPRPTVLLRAKQTFPAESAILLVWGKGVTSPSGVATSQDRMLKFRTRSPFTATFGCTRTDTHSDCVPISEMTLSFSSDIARSAAEQIYLISADGKQKWLARIESSSDSVSYLTFSAPFPPLTTLSLHLPPNIADDANRTLTNASAFPLTVHTDDYPPLAKFSGDFGIIESKYPVLPVTVRNIEGTLTGRMTAISPKIFPPTPRSITDLSVNITGAFEAMSSKSEEESLFDYELKKTPSGWFVTMAEFASAPFSLPKPRGPKAFEVMGIPLKKGLHVVEIESALLGTIEKPKFVATSALVTNLSVHLKLGLSSLVWVTALDTGNPVVGAHIAITDCESNILWTGTTGPQGFVTVSRLPPKEKLPRCERIFFGRELLVIAQTPNDFAFVSSSWNDGISPWRFQLRSTDASAPTVAHSVLDRSLLRPGETLHMKHFIRNRTPKGIRLLTTKELPKKCTIRHIFSEESVEIPLRWDGKLGTAESTWTIPETAKLGEYEIILHKDAAHHTQFRVEAFRVPLMEARIIPTDATPIAPKTVTFDMSLRHLSGGGASGHSVIWHSQLYPDSVVTFPDHEGFVFGNGTVTPGVAPLVPETEASLLPATRQDLTLDAYGMLRTSVPIALAPQTIPHNLITEMEYRDPNGEIQTASTSTLIWPASWLIGIKPNGWFHSQKRVTFGVRVTDITGKIIPNVPVVVTTFKKTTYSHRKRLVGGFYAYDHTTHITEHGTFCRGTTDKTGSLSCEGASPVSGNILFLATTTDPEKRLVAAHHDMWISGSEESVFWTEDHDRMDIIPENKRVSAGQVARIQVRSPFRKATALVTIERDGILDAFVHPISGKDPVIAVPIKSHYSPNVFVSVLAVRGRIGEVQPTAMVDLGRPAFKLGITELEIGWEPHTLKVTVQTDKDAYRVRGTAKVRVKVQKTNGIPLPDKSEVALIAVDDGLLELWPNTSWNLLAAMMAPHGYGVETATAQMHVVGKRHFGLKAVPTGGGGGELAQGMTRALFDTLLFWKASVPLSPAGEALVSVPLNDSLTRFRVVAVATAGSAWFGTGETTIRTTQELMMFSGISPVIRTGDITDATITLRNTMAETLSVTVTPTVTAHTFTPKTLTLQPNESQQVQWPIHAPENTAALTYVFDAKSATVDIGDRLQISQAVIPTVPERVIQNILHPVTPSQTFPIALPKNATRGKIRTTVSPSIASDLSGIATHMTEYPYTCLEQTLSRIIATDDTKGYDTFVRELPGYLDAQGLAKFFPSMSEGDPILTAYILAILHEANRKLPEKLANQLTAALKSVVKGTLPTRHSFSMADEPIQKLIILEALSRYGQVQADDLSTIRLTPKNWPLFAVALFADIISRMSQPPAQLASAISEAEGILKSRSITHGATMTLSAVDAAWWLLSSKDSTLIRWALSLMERTPKSPELPKWIRGIFNRQTRGHWDTTFANAWGTLALRKFTKLWEAETLAGITTAKLGLEAQTLSWSEHPKGKQLTWPWQTSDTTLAISHTGSGQPWANILFSAAVPALSSIFHGYTIQKTITPEHRKDPSGWSVGDTARITLTVLADAFRSWVVIEDPIPAGATILGGGLKRDSGINTSPSSSENTLAAEPTFVERTHTFYRAYFQAPPERKWSVSYTVRFNQSGTFQMPPTRTEAMYDPDIYGELPNAAMVVLR